MLPWLVSSAAHAEDEAARVCIARDGRFVGFAIPFLVRAEDRPVALLKNRRRFCVQAEPGTYTLSLQGNFANVGTAVGANGTAVVVGASTSSLGDTITVELAPDATVYLEAELRSGLLLWRKRDAADWEAFSPRETRPQDWRMDQWEHGRLEQPVRPGPAPGAPAAEPATDGTIDAATCEALRALGYLTPGEPCPTLPPTPAADGGAPPAP